MFTMVDSMSFYRRIQKMNIELSKNNAIIQN